MPRTPIPNFRPIERLRSAVGLAKQVLIVLIDDVGFGASSVFRKARYGITDR